MMELSRDHGAARTPQRDAIAQWDLEAEGHARTIVDL